MQWERAGYESWGICTYISPAASTDATLGASVGVTAKATRGGIAAVLATRRAKVVAAGLAEAARASTRGAKVVAAGLAKATRVSTRGAKVVAA